MTIDLAKKREERRSNPICRCPEDIKAKIAHASVRLLLKRLMMEQQMKQAGNILLKKCLNLFVILIIIGSIINAIWLVFGCTLKVRPMGKSEGYGIEFVLSKEDDSKDFNRNIDLIILENYNNQISTRFGYNKILDSNP